MGVDYNVYVGPYVEIEILKKPTKKETYEYPGCPKPICRKYHEAQNKAKFCSDCGAAIETIVEEVDEEWDIYELLEHHEVIGEMYPDSIDEENGDTQLFFPCAEDLKAGSWSLKYDSVWEDLSDLNVEEEIQKVKDQCSKSLAILEEVYGAKPVVKWGVIGMCC